MELPPSDAAHAAILTIIGYVSEAIRLHGLGGLSEGDLHNLAKILEREYGKALSVDDPAIALHRAREALEKADLYFQEAEIDPIWQTLAEQAGLSVVRAREHFYE